MYSVGRRGLFLGRGVKPPILSLTVLYPVTAQLKGAGVQFGSYSVTHKVIGYLRELN